jgi:hypothetical protein
MPPTVAATAFPKRYVTGTAEAVAIDTASGGGKKKEEKEKAKAM